MDRTTKPPSRTPPPSHPCPLTFHLPRAFRTEASIGAVREALANDITRLLGIPAQELSLVRGEYSDGHPKLMLAAKYAEGYKDLEAGFLKGNGKDLDIHDDLSFTDRNPNPLDKRFANYSVFDDDTRFAKFQGVLKLRELVRSRRIDDLFADYLATFRTDAGNLSRAERNLREKIIFNVGAMSAEFHRQVERILAVFEPQLAAFDALAPHPPQGAPAQL